MDYNLAFIYAVMGWNIGCAFLPDEDGDTAGWAALHIVCVIVLAMVAVSTELGL